MCARKIVRITRPYVRIWRWQFVRSTLGCRYRSYLHSRIYHIVSALHTNVTGYTNMHTKFLDIDFVFFASNFGVHLVQHRIIHYNIGSTKNQHNYMNAMYACCVNFSDHLFGWRARWSSQIPCANVVRLNEHVINDEIFRSNWTNSVKGSNMILHLWNGRSTTFVDGAKYIA